MHSYVQAHISAAHMKLSEGNLWGLLAGVEGTFNLLLEAGLPTGLELS